MFYFSWKVSTLQQAYWKLASAADWKIPRVHLSPGRDEMILGSKLFWRRAL
jgi:hypothetical protein